MANLENRRSLSRRCKETAIARILMPLVSGVSPKTKTFKRVYSLDRQSKAKVYDSANDENDFEEFSDTDSDPKAQSDIDSEESSCSEDSFEDEIISKTSKLRLSRKSNISRSASVPRVKNLPTENGSEEKLVFEHLPCRDAEHDVIRKMIHEKISHKVGGCLFISGLPGTGKTATVKSVLARLSADADESLSAFSTVLINGMEVTEPRQLCTMLYRKLTGQRVAHSRSQTALKQCIFSRSRPTVLLIDEVDQLYRQRGRGQDLLYMLFDWAQQRSSRLVILAIANTMDLPERIFQNKLSSRLSVLRLTFEPYTPQQLTHIIQSRIDPAQLCHFEANAIEFATKKVAASSGDARRAIEICKRAIEMREPNRAIDTVAIDQVIKKMFSSPMLRAVQKSCSVYEQLFLRSLVASYKKFGSDEVSLKGLLPLFNKICSAEGFDVLTIRVTFDIIRSLHNSRLLIYDSLSADINMKLKLCCSLNDISFVLEK